MAGQRWTGWCVARDAVLRFLGDDPSARWQKLGQIRNEE
jgi:hypothetical protein